MTPSPPRPLAGGTESREEAQPLTDQSEGEPDFPRPAEDDGESLREEAADSDHEEFRFGSMDQGEPGSGPGGWAKGGSSPFGGGRPRARPEDLRGGLRGPPGTQAAPRSALLQTSPGGGASGAWRAPRLQPWLPPSPPGVAGLAAQPRWERTPPSFPSRAHRGRAAAGPALSQWV